MKKCTTMLLALVAALLLLPGMARAADASGTCGEDLTWTLSVGVLSIEGTGPMEDYATSAAPWYSYRNEIQSIQIGDGVTTIGDWAFFNCSKVADVIVPEGVTSIGESAFESCRDMVSISLPSSLKENPGDWRNHYGLGKSAFKNCRSLTSITLPDGVTNIPESAFEECVSLVSIDIPDSVTVIWLYAFQGCSSLKEVRIPDSVTTLWGYSFRGCTSLERVTISDNVTEIQGGMFFDCTSLSSINIPDNVTHIGAYAFNGCKSLAEIDIPNRVASIEFGAFQDCSSLTSVILPDSVSTIEQSTFSGCTSLTQVTIPDSITTIESYAFADCSALTEITIPGSVAAIDGFIFWGCTSLTQVTLPGSVTNIGRSAFYNCNSLTDVFYSGSKEQWKAVTIETQWGANVPLFRAIIHCSDGDIIPVRGVTLSPNSLDMVVGESVTLTAEIAPANADNKNLVWTSSYPDVASVDKNGTVTALKYGYARITVETEEGGYTAECTVNVSDIPTCWVTFDSGRGYGYMSEAHVQKGITYTLPECTFTAPDKMEFDCWEIGGKQYQPGDRITVTNDVTVSALWKDAPVAEYTVTFLSNGGTGTMAPVKIEDGKTYPLPACGFTPPEGQKFSHWEIGGRSYATGARITVTGNLTAKAVYSQQTSPQFTFQFNFDDLDVVDGQVTINVDVYLGTTYVLTIPVKLSLY